MFHGAPVSLTPSSTYSPDVVRGVEIPAVESEVKLCAEKRVLIGRADGRRAAWRVRCFRFNSDSDRSSSRERGHRRVEGNLKEERIPSG